MSQGTVSFPGIVAPKGSVYTQTLGVYPDRVAIRCIPQVSAIPATGTVTFAWGASTLTLPNCYFDSAQIVADASEGFLMSLAFFDRRALWGFFDTISGIYNVFRIDSYVTAKKKSLRQLVEILLIHLGETSPNVSALSNTIFPEVRWQDANAVKELDALLTEWGFGLALGFGSEAVTVVQLGAGASLSTTNAMMASNSIDPRIRPEYIRVRFGSTKMQARFKLEAVAFETSNTVVPIASASYEPAVGWGKEHPEKLPNLQQEVGAGSAEYKQAIRSVYRAYRIKHFADGTLDLPDGSGTLTSIQQCLPVENRLLAVEYARDDGNAIPFRLYGKRFIPKSERGEPAVNATSSIDDEIVGEKVLFDGELGLLLFERPQWYVDAGAYLPAELYLECSFQITDATDNYPLGYYSDVLLDAAGVGFKTIPLHEQANRVIVTYTTGQTVDTVSDSETDLDAIAAIVASQVSSQYSTIGAQFVAYNQPVFTLRCDGAIYQVQHVISDGTRHAGSFSSASRNAEFDRQILTRDERTSMNNALFDVFTSRSKHSLTLRQVASDD